MAPSMAPQRKLLTLIHSLLTLVPLPATPGFLRFFRIGKLTKVLRVFRMLRPVTLVAKEAFHNPIKAQIFKFVCWFIICLLILSGVVQVASDLDHKFGYFWNSDEKDMSLLDAFYFVIVTMATVGYGDLSP